MPLSDILLLGDERLLEVCEPVTPNEVAKLMPVARSMADLVVAFRKKYGAGRAIAAPQVGVLKRLVVLNIDHPVVMFNPELHQLSEDKITLWDDCMSFPNLLVKVERHASCTLTFFDKTWSKQSWALSNDLAELLQHECDHLDGILAIHRAVDQHAYRWRVTTSVPPWG